MVSVVKTTVLRDLKTCSFSTLKEPGKDQMRSRETTVITNKDTTN